MLNIVDMASYQSGADISKMTTTDGCIIKASEGSSDRSNPYFKKWCDQTLAVGKKLGAYHYLRGIGAQAEADIFCKKVEPYLGKIILAADWETSVNNDPSKQGYNKRFNDPAYCLEFMNLVYKKTGVKCLFYTMDSYLDIHDCSPIAKKGYRLWIAQYANMKRSDFKANPWQDGTYPGFSSYVMHQYSSVGGVTGYSGNIDKSIWLGDGLLWDFIAAGEKETSAKVIPDDKLPTLRKGSVGAQVALVQWAVGVTIDFCYGSETEERVKMFQTANGLTPDGVVGPKTWPYILAQCNKTGRNFG